MLVRIQLEEQSVSPGKGNADFFYTDGNGCGSSKGERATFYFPANIMPCNQLYIAQSEITTKKKYEKHVQAQKSHIHLSE